MKTIKSLSMIVMAVLTVIGGTGCASRKAGHGQWVFVPAGSPVGTNVVVIVQHYHSTPDYGSYSYYPGGGYSGYSGYYSGYSGNTVTIGLPRDPIMSLLLGDENKKCSQQQQAQPRSPRPQPQQQHQSQQQSSQRGRR